MQRREHLLEWLRSDQAQLQIQDGLEVHSTRRPVEFLSWCAKRGFLLHGSHLLLATLEPRKPVDLSRPEGRATAVYMSQEPARAMYSAIAVGERGGYEVYLDSSGAYTRLDFYVRRRSNIARYGYVYVMARSAGVEFVDGDVVSYSPMAPLIRLLFLSSDFPYMIRVAQPEQIPNASPATPY